MSRRSPEQTARGFRLFAAQCLPGSPLYDDVAGLDGLIDAAMQDLRALQEAGFDAVMFGNENDRPYEFRVDAASTATMAYVIGRLRREITVPFGVNVLWDAMSSIALAAATGASFVREIMISMLDEMQEIPVAHE